MGARAAAAPFAQPEPGGGAEQHEHDHVDGPAGELVFAHADVAQAVEKELPIPKQAGQGGQRVVVGEGGRGSFRDRSVDGRGRGEPAVFPGAAVAEVEPEAVERRGDEGASAGEDVDHVALEDSGAVFGRDFRDGLAGAEGQAEDGGEHAGQHAQRETLAQLEGARVGPPGEVAFLEPAGPAGDEDAERPEGHAGENPTRAGAFAELAEGAVEHRRQQGAHHAGDADRDGVGQGDAEVADRDAEGGAADAVERAEGEGLHHGRARGLGEHLRELRHGEPGDQPGQDDPANRRLGEPEGLPAPAGGAFLRGVADGGGEGADGVEGGAEKRVGLDHVGVGRGGGESNEAKGFRGWARYSGRTRRRCGRCAGRRAAPRADS